MEAHPIEALVLGLGATPDAIAAALEREGVQGIMCSSCACPLAVYLARQGYRVEVGPFALQLNGEGRWDLPEPFLDFLDRFDGGRYPKLELSAEARP